MRKIRKAISGSLNKVNKPEYRCLALESLEQRVLLNGAGYESYTDNYDWPAAAGDMGQTLLPSLDLVKFTPVSENGNFEVSDVATDSQGNIYVAGTVGQYANAGAIGKGGFKQLVQSHNGRDDGFVAKYSSDGVPQWLTFIGGSNDDSISQIAVDSSGIWISGSTYSYASNSTTVFPGYENAAFGGSFVAGLTTNGAWRWTSSVSENILNEYGVTSYSIGSYNSSEGGPLVSFPGNGTAYALVSVYDESKGYNNEESIAVASISSSGALSVVSDFSYDFYDLPGRTVERSVIVSPDKVISIINATGGVNSYDLMVMTPDSVNLVTGFDGIVLDHGTDSQGNLIVSGYLSNNSKDGFVAKHYSNGSLAWQVEMGGSGEDDCIAVAGDSSGNIYFGGTSFSPDDFPLVNSFEQPESYYFPFYGQIDSDGEVLWNTAVGKSGDQWIGSAYYSGLAVSEGSVVFAWADNDYDTYDPLLAIGRISTEAGEDLPTASLVSDYVVGGQALVTDMNSAKYIDVKFDDTRNASVNGDEISLAGEGAEGVSLKGKPKLVDKQENIWRYVIDGAFTAGPVILNYLSNTFTNSDGQPNASASETFYAIPDMAPLAFSVESTEFTWNDLTSRYEYEGSYSIGMKPAAGSSYQSLINVSSGSLSYDKTRIYGQGIVSTAITGANLNLFSGDFEIVIGQSKTDILVESGVSLAAAWELAGCDYQFTSLALAEGKIQTQGTLHMPTEFGSAELAVSGDQAIVLASTGISLTGSTLTLPSVELDLPWLQMNAESLSVEYIAATAAAPGTAAQPDKLRFRGKVVLPDVFNATADLTKNELTNTDGYLEINGNGEVKWFGKLSVEDIVIVPDLWEVKEASLELREVAGIGLSVQGDAKVVIPPGIEIVCGLGFVNEKFNYIRLGVGDLDIPIGATGAFLQEINGLVNNIADEDATKIAFGGGVGFTAGPKLNLSLPSWAGGDLEGSLAEFGLEGALNHEELTGTGTLEMVGGLVEGQAVAALNWDKGTLSSGCTLTALDGLITIDGKFNADSNMNVNVIGQGKVTIPSIVPLWGGRQISGATSQLVFTNDDNYGNDFVAGWGSLSMSILGKVRTIGLGLKVNFDGSYSILGSKESTRTQLSVPEPAASPIIKSCAAVAAGDSEVGPLANNLTEAMTETSDVVTRYQVADGSEWLMINASWESGSLDSMYLLAPDGTRYDDFINSDKVTIVNDLSGNNNSVIFVDSPESGTWQLVVESAGALSGLAFDGYHDSVMPEITVEQISYNELAGNVSVTYQADGSLANRQVAFYCDTDSADADGVLLGYDTDGDGVFSGDVSALASGEYYIYAMVYDDVNMPTVSYSEQTVSITEQAEFVSVDFGTGSAGKVTYTDADGTVVTVTVKGDNGVLKFAGDNITVATAKNAATVSGTNLVLSSVQMAGNGPAALTFAAKGGADNSATIGNISGNEFKSLTGKGIVLAGNVDLTGSLGAMKWGDIDDMVNISANAPLKGLSITAANVGDQVNVAIDGILKSVAVTSYGSGSIIADSIGKVAVKQGDFAASVTALTGDIQALTVTGAINGNISAANAIKAVTTKGTLSATLRAGAVIGKVTALDMVDSFLSSGGDVTSVTLKGKMLNSNVIAGYDLGSDMVFGNDDLAGSGNIGSVSVMGEFADSSLMAGVLPDIELASGTDYYLPWVGTSGKISKIKFGSINYDSDSEFGLYAADTIASFKIGKTIAQSQGDFVIQTY